MNHAFFFLLFSLIRKEDKNVSLKKDKNNLNIVCFCG